jgi:hypothetical protein
MSAKKCAREEKKALQFVGNPEALKPKLKQLGGSQSDEWNLVLVNQAINTLLFSRDEEFFERQKSATLAALVGIDPKDEIEGMIGAQLLAAHNAAMECYRRAMIAEQSLEGRRENLNQANKLSRAYATLLEALNRHRGKGQQKVTVERVHVHAGGQALVGMVGASGGRGDQPKSEDQPHAKQIAHALQPEMWSADAERKQVPITSDGERPLSDARRKITGRTEGQ